MPLECFSQTRRARANRTDEQMVDSRGPALRFFLRVTYRSPEWFRQHGKRRAFARSPCGLQRLFDLPPQEPDIHAQLIQQRPHKLPPRVQDGQQQMLN